MFNAPNRRLVAAIGLVALAGVSALRIAAQTPSTAREKITFLALGTDNQPLADLKPAQLELKIDGKVRPVQAVQQVKIAASSADAAGAAPKGMFDSAVPAPYGFNSASAPSRNVMIVVDEESMRPGADKAIKDALDQFVGTLGAQDHVGLNTIPHGALSVPMSTSKSNVRDAITKVGGRLQANRSDNDAVCHTRDVADAFAGLLSNLGEGPTTVVLVSSGLVPPSAGPSQVRTAKTDTNASTCDFLPNELDKVGKASAAGHAIGYIVVGETGVQSTDMAGLQSFAGAFNGPVFNLGSSESPFTRILRESGSYYVAEFDADANEHDGKSHRVDLKLTTPDTVRTGTEVTLAKATSAKPTAKDIVKEAKIYSDLPLRTVGLVSRGTGEKIHLTAVVEPVDPAVKFTSVSVGFMNLGDTGGKMSTVSLSTDAFAGPFARADFEVAPGTYKIHAAAIDTNGRLGSVDYQVDATLTPSGPMKLSGLLLSATSGGAPKMQFSDEPEAVAFFELYGTTTSPISVAIELAETPDGKALKSAEPKLSQTSQPGVYKCEGTFDIKDLKPGDYVVRAIFGVEGNPPGKVFRTLRKIAK